jgi:hypothetical protein
MKKANALAEYSVLIFIVIAAIMGLNYALTRHFQAFIKSEADEHISQPIPFIWQETLKFSSQSVTQDRYEEVGGDTVVISDLNAPYTTLTAPPPPVVIGSASLHVQDAASAPPSQDNPEHQAVEDPRVVQPKP